MTSSDTNNLASELQRRAELKFGTERAEMLREDLQQLARELQALDAYSVGFDDEP